LGDQGKFQNEAGGTPSLEATPNQLESLSGPAQGGYAGPAQT
jgi:hypothetical protein